MPKEAECFSRASPTEPFADRQTPPHLGAFACPHRRQSPNPDWHAIPFYACDHPDFSLESTGWHKAFCPVYSLETQAALDQFLKDSNLEMPPLTSTKDKQCYRVFTVVFKDYSGHTINHIQVGGRFETVSRALEYAHQIDTDGNVWVAEESAPAHVIDKKV